MSRTQNLRWQSPTSTRWHFLFERKRLPFLILYAGWYQSAATDLWSSTVIYLFHTQHSNELHLFFLLEKPSQMRLERAPPSAALTKVSKQKLTSAILNFHSRSFPDNPFRPYEFPRFRFCACARSHICVRFACRIPSFEFDRPQARLCWYFFPTHPLPLGYSTE